MPDMHTDGNAVAGQLAELLAGDMTMAERTCQGCGHAWTMGAHRAYHGAGIVLRCPGCDAVALRVVVADDRRFVELRGVLEVRTLY